jgi:hypothetical protein
MECVDNRRNQRLWNLDAAVIIVSFSITLRLLAPELQGYDRPASLKDGVSGLANEAAAGKTPKNGVHDMRKASKPLVHAPVFVYLVLSSLARVHMRREEAVALRASMET